MNETADLNLVLALILPEDALKRRATAHVAHRSKLQMPFSVGLELLFVATKHSLRHVLALGAAEAHFEVERREVLYTAAEALDSGDAPSVFDAVHLADALHRGGSLHTADERLHGTPFPTTPF
ncbi:MAG TPA: hypothetical protein VI818_00450 [Candidatus Thermoplasmatota archaeon]|nr:hypothetical protein [Candidatus Thermoplasmatota archaeon]